MMYFDAKIRRSIYMYVSKYFPYKTYIFALYMYEYMIYCVLYMFIVCLYYPNDSTNIFSLYIPDIVSCENRDRDY